jgi:hypothetical protein
LIQTPFQSRNFRLLPKKLCSRQGPAFHGGFWLQSISLNWPDLAEFLPIGSLFTFASFMKIAGIAQIFWPIFIPC